MRSKGLIGRLPRWVKRTAGAIINNVEPLRRWVSRRVINRYAYSTPPRPRAISMAADYTTWPGLTDRRFSGRHLRIRSEDELPALPAIEKVVELFRRKELKLATDTSLLFPFFAQWFTDSFLRTKWEPEDSNLQFRLNESNHELDLCQIYGVGETQTTMLRGPRNGGRLQSQAINGEEWPAPLFEERSDSLVMREAYLRKPELDELNPAVPGLYTPANYHRVFDSYTDEQKRYAFAVGLEHGNATLANVIMNTLFLREHNRIAGVLSSAHQDWDDERVFQTARNVNIAVLINIVIGDYIAHIAPLDIRLEAPAGMAENERWYRNNWMAVEFALLYRWHDLIPEELVVNDDHLPSSKMRRANQWLLSHGLDNILLAASRQRAGRIGLGNTASFLIDAPPKGSDVKRLSIQMARSCKLPTFNTYRSYYGLTPVSSFQELTRDSDKAMRLEELYGSVDRLEWFVGLFAEGYGEDHVMGELMTTMVANDAFTQALTNPLFAKAVHNVDTFASEGLEIVQTTQTLGQVIARNTQIANAEATGFKIRVG